MNSNFKVTSLVLFLSFSVFCFCYLNLETSTPAYQAEIPASSESVSEADSKTNEILLPDLQLVESVSQFAIRLFRAL